MGRSSCSDAKHEHNREFFGIKRPGSRFGANEFRKFVVSRDGDRLKIRWFEMQEWAEVCKGEGYVSKASVSESGVVAITLDDLTNLELIHVFRADKLGRLEALDLATDLNDCKKECEWFDGTTADRANALSPYTGLVSQSPYTGLVSKEELLEKLTQFESLHNYIVDSLHNYIVKQGLTLNAWELLEHNIFIFNRNQRSEEKIVVPEQLKQFFVKTQEPSTALRPDIF